jgi:hypothetical protein
MDAAMRVRRAVLTVVVLLAAASAARADAIDGEWCSKQGQRIVIEGPQVVTPDGRATTGLYHRHGFVYEGLPGSAEAGQTIAMDLLNEEEVRVVRSSNGVAEPPQIWRRCQVIS